MYKGKFLFYYSWQENISWIHSICLQWKEKVGLSSSLKTAWESGRIINHSREDYSTFLRAKHWNTHTHTHTHTHTLQQFIRLSIIWKSDLTDKMKRSFFQAAVVSILLDGYTTWTLTKWLEKKLDGNYTRMLQAILNKTWQQHPTRHQLYGHLSPIMKTIQISWTRHWTRTLLEKQGRAHKWCTPMDPHIWPGKSRTTSLNIHTAAMWGYGM